MDFRPAEVRVSAEDSTVAVASTAAEATLEEGGIDEHQASDADKSTEGEGNDR
jgi:hypothetical protein